MPLRTLSLGGVTQNFVVAVHHDALLLHQSNLLLIVVLLSLRGHGWEDGWAWMGAAVEVVYVAQSLLAKRLTLLVSMDKSGEWESESCGHRRLKLRASHSGRHSEEGDKPCPLTPPKCTHLQHTTKMANKKQRFCRACERQAA